MKTFRNLLAILFGGFVVFQLLAIAQEWPLFASAWLGAGGEGPPELSVEDRQGAAEAVALTLSLMGHVYLSGGDPRFADRMPAGEGVLAELQADVEYLARNHRRQDLTLEDFQVTDVERLGEDRVEVRTQERWRVRFLRIPGGAEVEPARRQTLSGKYLVVRQGGGWRVEGWDFGGPEPAARSRAP